MSMVDQPVRRGEIPEPRFGFWRRSFAMVIKEFIQLRRDRVSFAMIVMIPVMQLLLFGYAINTTPRNLPTAVLLQEDSDVARSILKALENTAYFRFTREVHDVAEFDNLLLSGKVLFGVEIPRGFERAVRRGERPALLVAADATDPVAAGSAMSTLGVVAQTVALFPSLRAAGFRWRPTLGFRPGEVSEMGRMAGWMSVYVITQWAGNLVVQILANAASPGVNGYSAYSIS